MSKNCMMRREKRREKLVAKYAKVRTEMRAIINDPAASLEDKEQAQKVMQSSLPKDSNAVRQRNRCWKTGRGNGVYKLVGMCRNMFREHAMRGDIPGLIKSSWG